MVLCGVYGVISLISVTVLWCCMVCLWCDEFEFSESVMVLCGVYGVMSVSCVSVKVLYGVSMV
jgi:hypothetical protein